MLRRLLDRLYFVGVYLTIAGGIWILKLLPRRAVMRCTELFADLGYYLFHGFRNRSAKNLNLALGLDKKETHEVARNSLRNFIRDVVEMGYAYFIAPQALLQEIAVVGKEHLEKALAKGNGVIALSAHLGNFFLVPLRLTIEGYPTHVLVNPPNNRYLGDYFDRLRSEAGQKTIHARPQQQAYRALLQVLRQNELAFMIADEYRSGKGICVPFFGRRVLSRRGPATLALRTNAAVVPVYLIREPGGRLTLIVEPEIKLTRSGDIRADTAECTLRMTQWVEKVVRSYPDQWNWMTVHWHDAPHESMAGKELH
jgi:KDO2-lipid IV(A) lauroyltransferase